PPGAAAVAGAAPGIESAGRFGQRAALEHGWREWLAHELGRADLAGAAPACVAAAEVAPAGPPALASGTPWIATPLHLRAGAERGAPAPRRAAGDVTVAVGCRGAGGAARAPRGAPHAARLRRGPVCERSVASAGGPVPRSSGAAGGGAPRRARPRGGAGRG